MNNLNGLSFHRLIVPFSKVSDMVDFQCDVFPDLDAATDEQLKQYSAVVYQREIDTRIKKERRTLSPPF